MHWLLSFLAFFFNLTSYSSLLVYLLATTLSQLFKYRVFVMNIMIPGPPHLSFVAYLEGDKVNILNVLNILSMHCIICHFMVTANSPLLYEKWPYHRSYNINIYSYLVQIILSHFSMSRFLTTTKIQDILFCSIPYYSSILFDNVYHYQSFFSLVLFIIICY